MSIYNECIIPRSGHTRNPKTKSDYKKDENQFKPIRFQIISPIDSVDQIQTRRLTKMAMEVEAHNQPHIKRLYGRASLILINHPEIAQGIKAVNDQQHLTSNNFSRSLKDNMKKVLKEIYHSEKDDFSLYDTTNNVVQSSNQIYWGLELKSAKVAKMRNYLGSFLMEKYQIQISSEPKNENCSLYLWEVSKVGVNKCLRLPSETIIPEQIRFGEPVFKG